MGSSVPAGGGRSGEELQAGWPVVSAVSQPWPWWGEISRAARLAMGARGASCGRPVGQGRAPDICREARRARMGSEVGMGCGGPMQEKAPPAVRPASPGSKARRPCMQGGSRIRRRGRRETCGPWHAGGTCPLGRGCRRGLPRSAETSLNNYYPPTCAHPVERPSHACPHPARACIVLPRAAPQSMRPREPREPDTAEDAGGQTDHLGQAL